MPHLPRGVLFIAEASAGPPGCRVTRPPSPFNNLRMADATEMPRNRNQGPRRSRVAGNPPDPAQARYDAIHRALLTGLLGNVGMRSRTPHEYEDAGGRSFISSPGRLFSARSRPG